MKWELIICIAQTFRSHLQVTYATVIEKKEVIWRYFAETKTVRREGVILLLKVLILSLVYALKVTIFTTLNYNYRIQGKFARKKRKNTSENKGN